MTIRSQAGDPLDPWATGDARLARTVLPRWPVKASLAVGALRVGEAPQEAVRVDAVGWYESSFDLRQGLEVVELSWPAASSQTRP
jgi:hypothetical protein